MHANINISVGLGRIAKITMTTKHLFSKVRIAFNERMRV